MPATGQPIASTICQRRPLTAARPPGGAHHRREPRPIAPASERHRHIRRIASRRRPPSAIERRQLPPRAAAEQPPLAKVITTPADQHHRLPPLPIARAALVRPTRRAAPRHQQRRVQPRSEPPTPPSYRHSLPTGGRLWLPASQSPSIAAAIFLDVYATTRLPRAVAARNLPSQSPSSQQVAAAGRHRRSMRCARERHDFTRSGRATATALRSRSQPARAAHLSRAEGRAPVAGLLPNEPRARASQGRAAPSMSTMQHDWTPPKSERAWRAGPENLQYVLDTCGGRRAPAHAQQ